MCEKKHENLQFLNNIITGEAKEEKQDIIREMRMYHNSSREIRRMVATLFILSRIVDSDIWNETQKAVKEIGREYINDTGRPDVGRKE
jgi:hypothetical protein